MGMQAEDDGLPVGQVAAHPFDRVGVDVGGRHLDRGGQVEDDRVIRCGLDDFAHGIAYLFGVLQLGPGVGLRRIFEAPLRAGVFRGLLDTLAGTVGRDGLHRGPVGTKDHAALQNRRRVVEVHDGPGRTRARLERALDQFRSALGQHLDGDVVRNGAVGDDLADEVEVGLAGRREADLDLLVAHPHQEIEHAALAGRAHRVDQRLVAVAQIHRAPQGGAADDAVGPAAVGEPNGLDFLGERPVPIDRHRRCPLGIPGGLVGTGRACRLDDGSHRDVGVRAGRFWKAGHDRCSGLSEGTSDRRIANTRDGRPVWIRPRRGVRGGAPAARFELYRAQPFEQKVRSERRWSVVG